MLTNEDNQVVREVVIQVDAMLYDDQRRKDANIWRAILTEPPADQDAIREALSEKLYPRLRPSLEDGSLPQPVLAFLSQWFGWSELDNAADNRSPATTADPLAEPGSRAAPDAQFSGKEEEQSEQRPSLPNFWPAVIGWIAGLIILTSIFTSFSGS
jgi:hypothetical protein